MAKKSIAAANRDVALIEIDSNVIALKIAQKTKSGLNVMDSLVYPLRLGRDTFNNGRISSEKADKACKIIRNYITAAAGYGVTNVRAIATAAVREAGNRDYFLDQVLLKTGLNVELLDNQEENFYIYKSMLKLLNKEYKQSSIMVYSNSGNLSISLLEKEKICFMQNIKVGSLRLSELFEDVHDYSAEFYVIVEEYLDSFTDSIEAFLPADIDYFIATSNEIALIGDLCGAEKKDNVLYIKKEIFNKLYDEIKFKSVNKIMEDYKTSIDDAEVLLPAMCIYNNLFRFTHANMIVSPLANLSDAVVNESLFEEEYEKMNEEFQKSVLISATALANRYQCLSAHYTKVEKFSLAIFDRLKRFHCLGARERLLLQTAAILHDVGKFINISGHYRHSYHIIRNLDIIGLSGADLEIIASVALYHGMTVPLYSDKNYRKLRPKDRVTVSKLSAIMRVADTLDRSHEQKFDDIEVKIIEDELIILIQTDRNIELEQWAFNMKSGFFEEIFGIKATLKKKRVI